MGARAKFIIIALIFLFGIDLHAQSIPYQLNPPAPNARVQFCPVPDGGYPCPTLTTVYSDSATTQVINQPISTGSSGNLSVYFAAGTSSVTVQFLGQGYGPQNRFIVSLGASGVAPNNPLPAVTSGPGPVFNVKNYGAKGDTQSSSNCTTSTLNLNCTDVTFTTANLTQRVSCIQNGGGALFGGQPTTFAAFVDSHDMTLAASGGSSSVTCMWGTPDDTAVTTALTAALAQMCNLTSSGNVCTSTAAPQLYFPAGAYNLFGTSINIVAAHPRTFTVRGDGPDQSKVYWHEGATNAANAGLTCPSGTSVVIRDITFDGAFQTQLFSNALFLSCNVAMQDVIVQRFGTGITGISVSGGNIEANRITSVSNGGAAVNCNGCTGEIYESLISNNNGGGFLISNTDGLSGGQGLRLTNNLFDENGGASGCNIEVLNSRDIWFQGLAAFMGPSSCVLHVDGQSFVHWTGGVASQFGNETVAATGVKIDSGGILQSSDVRYVGDAGGKCINNSGIFNDNGGNSCETKYVIASGTSTGTTAVLTMASNGVNVSTNCSVGDALIVQGVGVAGYNGYFPAGATSGITAVTATTLTYTTAGSNLGAVGTAGTAFCRNFNTYAGNLPRALLNNPVPNTCNYVITPIANATTVTLCNFSTGTATNITRIRASSQATTTCATPPLITISDGTVSQTLTLTSGKNSWDSSVDASTGVGTTIFKPNGTITVKYDVAANSACATPATNLAVSYNITPILSN